MQRLKVPKGFKPTPELMAKIEAQHLESLTQAFIEMHREDYKKFIEQYNANALTAK